MVFPPASSIFLDLKAALISLGLWDSVAASVAQAMHQCGASRIGHATRLIEDPALVAAAFKLARSATAKPEVVDLGGARHAVVELVSVTDGDEDVVSEERSSTALSLTFTDTDPTASITAPPVVGAAAVVEAGGGLGARVAGLSIQSSIQPSTLSSIQSSTLKAD